MKIIEKELNNFNDILSVTLSKYKNKISCDIYDFIFSKSKRLRPKIIFLTAKALGIDINDEIYSLACGVELIHNSTLIHDDIIDDADLRRGKISLNKKFDNSLSVLAGDYTLAIAMEFLYQCKNVEIIKIFSDSLRKMCEGEIDQNFNKGKFITLDEYITKCEKKTAELFTASVKSLLLIANFKSNSIINFVKNFGIAFQLRDDIINILNTDNTKPALSDIYNGIYTAAIIFLKQKNPDIEQISGEEIVELLEKNNEVIIQTINLIEKYAMQAIASMEFIKDNQYKTELINLAQDLYKVGLNE